MFSSDVGLSFGLDKCARLTISRGKIVKTDNLTVSPDVSNCGLTVGETYKHLGFVSQGE